MFTECYVVSRILAAEGRVRNAVPPDWFLVPCRTQRAGSSDAAARERSP